MNWFFSFAIISFAGMIVMLRPKVSIVRKFEIEHEGHMGFGIMIKPFIEAVQNKIKQAWVIGYNKSYPYVAKAILVTTSRVHSWMLCLSSRLIHLAEVIRGRGMKIGKRESSSFFLRDVAEFKKTVNGRIDF